MQLCETDRKDMNRNLSADYHEYANAKNETEAEQFINSHRVQEHSGDPSPSIQKNAPRYECGQDNLFNSFPNQPQHQ